MKKVDRYFYPAIFTYEEDQEIAVEFPDLNVATSGVNDDDALLSARELLGTVMFGLEEDGETIPEPTRLSEIALVQNERAVLIDVYMPSVRMANITRSVNRTVTLPAWLNAAALELNVNFSQVLQEALLQKVSKKS
nr:type II toxin-antitoxin system HicB family antitoxin [Massilistercora timonensis]